MAFKGLQLSARCHTHTHTHTHTHIQTYTHVYIYILVCMYVCMYMYIVYFYVCIHHICSSYAPCAHVSTHLFAYISAHNPKKLNTDPKHTCVHTYVHNTYLQLVFLHFSSHALSPSPTSLSHSTSIFQASASLSMSSSRPSLSSTNLPRWKT
jgi:hypothetical protein